MTDQTFKTYLTAMDMILTHATAARAEKTFNDNGAPTLEKLLWSSEHSYYLSDGGYSRICLVEDKIFLTSNSTPTVKAAWPLVAGIVDEIKKEIGRRWNLDEKSK